MAPFLWMGFNCLKAAATSRRQFTFYHSVLRNSCYSFYRPLKDKRLSRPWGHAVVLKMGPLDWESSALTTRPLLESVRPLLESVKVFLCCGGLLIKQTIFRRSFPENWVQNILYEGNVWMASCYSGILNTLLIKE